MFEGIIHYARSGGIHFALFFVFLFIYLILKMVLIGFGSAHRKARLHDFFKLSKSVIIIFFISMVFFAFLNFALMRINRDGIEGPVARNNYLLMELDNKLFGTYVPFWFENKENPTSFFKDNSHVFTWAYNVIAPIIAIGLILSLLKGRDAFIKTMAAFVFTICASLFIWFYFPATSPLDGYLDDHPVPITNAGIDSIIKNYDPSQASSVFLDQTRNVRAGLGSKLWVTSIPSMHIAWATLIAYSAFMVSWFAFIPALIYLLLNVVATLITLQHYGVDIIAGIFIACLAIFLVEKLYPRITNSAFDDLSTSLRNDLKKFGRLFKI